MAAKRFLLYTIAAFWLIGVAAALTLGLVMQSEGARPAELALAVDLREAERVIAERERFIEAEAQRHQTTVAEYGRDIAVAYGRIDHYLGQVAGKQELIDAYIQRISELEN